MLVSFGFFTMERTPHFACWCNLCMLSEWKELEAEINRLVFGRQDHFDSASPSPSLTRCPLLISPIAFSIDSQFGTGTSISPNEEVNQQFEPDAAITLGPSYPNEPGSWFQPDLVGHHSPNICKPPRSTAKRQRKTPADLKRAEPPRSRRLHVSNIPFWFEDHHLAKTFQNVGNVIQAEVIYNERGSKGFGFVTFEDEPQATNIRQLFNGSELHGRVIEVNYASKRITAKNKPRPVRERGEAPVPCNRNRIGQGPPCWHCHAPFDAAGRPQDGGAVPSHHRQNRNSRMSPTADWLQHHRQRFGPRL